MELFSYLQLSLCSVISCISLMQLVVVVIYCHVAMQELVSHVISSHVEGQGSKGAAHTMLKLQSSYSRWRDALVKMQASSEALA